MFGKQIKEFTKRSEMIFARIFSTWKRRPQEGNLGGPPVVKSSIRSGNSSDVGANRRARMTSMKTCPTNTIERH
jgi:hypothetical protein